MYKLKECVLCPVHIDNYAVKTLKPKDYGNMRGLCHNCRKKLKIAQIKVGGKVCTKCNTYKNYEEYPSNKGLQDGFDSWCRVCRVDARYGSGQSLEAFFRSKLVKIKEDRRKISSDLTLEILITLWNKQEGICAISGEKMSYQRHRRKENMSICSIDRIDSSKGYTLNNVQLVCWMVNRMKGEHITEELINWCNSIIKHQTTLKNHKL